MSSCDHDNCKTKYCPHCGNLSNPILHPGDYLLQHCISTAHRLRRSAENHTRMIKTARDDEYMNPDRCRRQAASDERNAAKWAKCSKWVKQQMTE